MEIPCKMTFEGLLTELQKMKFFLSTFKIDIISDTMIDDTSVSSDSSSVAIGSLRLNFINRKAHSGCQGWMLTA